jgi:hypothetical protein
MLNLSKDKATTLAYKCLDEKVPLSLIDKALYVLDEAYMMGRDDATAPVFIRQNPRMKLYLGQVGYLEHFCEERKIPDKYIDAVIAASELAYGFGVIDGVFNHPLDRAEYSLDLGSIVKISSKLLKAQNM